MMPRIHKYNSAAEVSRRFKAEETTSTRPPDGDYSVIKYHQHEACKAGHLQGQPHFPTTTIRWHSLIRMLSAGSSCHARFIDRTDVVCLLQPGPCLTSCYSTLFTSPFHISIASKLAAALAIVTSSSQVSSILAMTYLRSGEPAASPHE